jgi:hypothetical protein
MTTQMTTPDDNPQMKNPQDDNPQMTTQMTTPDDKTR